MAIINSELNKALCWIHKVLAFLVSIISIYLISRLFQFSKIMPFFGSKFSTAKCCKRRKIPFHSGIKIPENLDEPITIKLGSLESTFVDGEWKPVLEPNIELSRENEYLKEASNHLKEENNLLKMKIEILIDMLTEVTLDLEQRKDVTLHTEGKRI